MTKRMAMELFSWFEKRRAEREPLVMPVLARSRTVTGTWTAHVAAGDAVVADINEYGLRLSSDTAYQPGTLLRITVLAPAYGEPPVEVRAEVIWSRRNDLPQFGRHSCGALFKPEFQPEIQDLLARHPAPARAAEA